MKGEEKERVREEKGKADERQGTHMTGRSKGDESKGEGRGGRRQGR